MRTLKTSLALLSVLVPTTAFAQEPVALEEEPSAAAAAPAATAPAAPAAPAADASATGSASLGGATTTTAAATAAPAPAAAAPAPAAAARPPAARQGASTYGGAENDGSTWALTYSGYLRAPMRVGIGKNPTTGSMTQHAPVLPDDQYASWQFSPHNKREWAEMFFTMGNGIVSGTLAVQGFQFTDSTWANPMAQFGIGQGWVEINSDLGFENVKFNAKVGSHWNRYGRAGVYDAGEYDTYLFGRTHVLGGTARIDYDMDGTKLGFEGGYGVSRPNPEMYNRARFTSLAHAHAFLNLGEMEFTAHVLHAWSAQEVVPQYPATLPGSNCAAPGATPFSCTVAPIPNVAGDTTSPNSVFGAGYPNGSQTIFGVDARLDLGIGGYLYAGVAHQMLSNALTVGNAIESVHGLGAGNYSLGVVDNYLESSFCATRGYPQNVDIAAGNIVRPGAPNGSCSNGTGSITSILAQYELSLSNFNIFEDDSDIKLKLYGMMNLVGVGKSKTVGGAEVSEDVYLAQTLANGGAYVAGKTLDDLKQDGVMKLKFGADAEYFFLPWMSAGIRFDRLQPNSKIAEQTFMILSPRISFRSQMVTHETITLSYSRYMYSQRLCNGTSPAANMYNGAQNTVPDYYDSGIYAGTAASATCVQPPASASPPDGFGSTSDNQPTGNRGAPTLTPDENVIKLEASMWW